MTDSETPDTLTDVHSALQEATLESKTEKAMKNFSVRLPDGLKAQAQEICARNATDLGTFLRKCAEGLVRDYGAKPQE